VRYLPIGSNTARSLLISIKSHLKSKEEKDRTSAIQLIKILANNATDDARKETCETIIGMLKDKLPYWYQRHGPLSAMLHILKKTKNLPDDMTRSFLTAIFSLFGTEKHEECMKVQGAVIGVLLSFLKEYGDWKSKLVGGCKGEKLKYFLTAIYLSIQSETEKRKEVFLKLRYFFHFLI